MITVKLLKYYLVDIFYCLCCVSIHCGTDLSLGQLTLKKYDSICPPIKPKLLDDFLLLDTMYWSHISAFHYNRIPLPS